MNRLSSLKHMQHLMHIIIKKKMKRKKRKKKMFSLHVFVNIQYYETLTRFNTRTIYIEYGYNSKKYSLLYFVVILISGMHLVGGRGGERVRTPALFRYNSNCAIKFLDQFRRNALKNQFKKRKKPSKRCTNRFS